MRPLLIILVLITAAASPTPGEREVPLARVGDMRLEVALAPETGLVTLEASLTVAPSDGATTDILTLRLRDDMEVVRAVADAEGRRLEARQGGGFLRLHLDPPVTDPVRVRLTMVGSPAEPRRAPFVGRDRAFLPGVASWYPRGRGGRLRLTVKAPDGWTVLGTGLGLDEDLNPAFAPVPDPVGGAWLLAEPGLVVRAAADPVPFILAGPADVEKVVSSTVERTSRTLGDLQELLGPLPGRSVLLAGLHDLDEPLALPGAVVAPFDLLRDDLEMGRGDLTALIRYWWGGHVAAAPGDDPRWLAGFAAGLAAEIAREYGGPRPRALAELDEAHWRLADSERAALSRVRRSTPDEAVVVPAAGILQSFALHVGPETFRAAVRAVTDRFGGREVDLEAFTTALEQAADLRTPFFDAWLQRPGPADLRVTWDASPVGDKWDVSLEIHQAAPLVPLPVEVTLSGRRDGKREALHRIFRTAESHRVIPLRLRFEPDLVEADPAARVYRWTGSGRALARRADLLREAGRLADLATSMIGSDPGAAKEAIEEALELDPHHPQARLARARLLLDAREVEASREIAQAIAGGSPGDDYDEIHWVRAWAEVIVGRGWDLRRDRRRALDAYGRALALPDGRGAHRAAREGIRTPFGDES